ncbi:MAG TPA: MFS transporter [Pseudolabrys sp.]|uniref:MFS transporter n=1 Tax=Pseudolabrys sp. TaxID=1960880 RepID=UPI002DDD68F4|nr:MFS transporter [Pseudolabrys sp.]HEV2629258.1 MFS transporter [Pseudolabrys sp.]
MTSTTVEQRSAQLVARFERLPFSRWHRNFFILAFCGIAFDAADFALFGAALPPVAREFGLGPAQSGLLATVGLVGAFLGALFWGTLSDYIGRRTAFQSTVGLFAIFSGLVAVSWNVASLGVFRFLSNFGLGGEVPVTLTLSSEFSPGRIRGGMAGNIMAAFPVGLVIAAGLSLLIIPRWGWRGLFVVSVVPAVLLFFVRRYMPESVRYLLAKGRIAEAEKTVDDIERQAIGRTLTAAEIDALPNLRPEVATETKVTVFELLAPGRAKNTLLLWVVSFGFLWSSNGILFMLPTILQQRGIPLSQAISFMLVQAIAAVFGYSACGFLIDKYGRRPVLFLYYFIGAFCHLWFAMASGMWLYFAAAAVGWVNPGVYGATGIYVSELHPTHLRATAVGWFFGIGRIGSFLAPTVVGFMLAYGAGAYVLHTFALSFLVAAFALLAIGVETRGKALEEISQARAS